MEDSASSYATAQRRILNAHEHQATFLDLSDLPHLDAMPNELSRLSGIVALDLSKTRIEAIGAIKQLKNLKILRLAHTPIQEIDILREISELEVLVLCGTRIHDIGPLASQEKLAYLDLGDAKEVMSFDVLSKLRQLQWLNLAGTNIIDLMPLSNLRELSLLSLERTRVVDIAALADLKRLRHLSLDNSRVLNLRYVKLLPELSKNPMPMFEDAGELGVTFKNTCAAVSDSGVSSASAVMDARGRVAKLLRRLEAIDKARKFHNMQVDSTLVPRYVIRGADHISTVHDPIGNGDLDSEHLKEDLIRKSGWLDLALKAFPDYVALRKVLGRYTEQLRRALSDIRASHFYSAANALRASYEDNLSARVEGRDHELLPLAVSAALADLVETHALFSIAFPRLVDLHRNLRDAISFQGDSFLPSCAADILAALEASPTILDADDLAAIQNDYRAAQAGAGSGRIGAMLLDHRLTNFLGAIGRKRYDIAVECKSELVQDSFLGEKLVHFLIENQRAIGAYLDAGQDGRAQWWPEFLSLLKAVTEHGGPLGE